MATAASETTDRVLTRGVQFVPQGIGGYDENWYPVCLSTEVKPDRVRGFRFLNGKVIVFRNRDGEVSVMSAYCRHLGVDLSLAEVDGHTIRCPYHHWEYDNTGQCVGTAVGDEPPSKAKLYRYISAERYGLIWAYNGTEPGYELPGFPIEDNELEFIVCRSVELPMDSFMLYSNTMDLQHLVSLHKVKFETWPEDIEVTDRTISYSQDMVAPKIGRAVQHVKLHGTNCITLCAEIKGRPTFMMSSGLNVKGPLTRTFNVTATTKSGSPHGKKAVGIPLLDKLAIKLHLKAVDAFGKKLNAEDDPIFRTISPRIDSLSPSDKCLQIYFKFARNYPRSNIAEDLICNDYHAAAPK
jgi:phenylpropionate dioxygenase-like ring-hydroxylating dioxygenase large terminal subunit